MRTPTLSAIENLRFTADGQVWAEFLLHGMSYGLRADKEKEVVRLVQQTMFRTLTGESLLLGLASNLDAEGLVEQMVQEVDLDAHPAWAAECEASLDLLDRLRPGRRVYWLAVPLPLGAGAFGVRANAARQYFEGLLGLPPRAPSRELLTTARAKARAVLEAIPAALQPKPVSPSQMRWLHQHMLDRGLYLDEVLPQQGTVPKQRSAFAAPLMDEGGRTDDAKRATFNPLQRRYLKVQSPQFGAEDGASYQSMMILSDVPDGEIPFPGGELLGRIDECGLAVDWALRLTVRSSNEVLRTNQRALNTLNEQFHQRDGEVSHSVGALDRAAESLAEYAGILESEKHEVECQVTLIFSVAAADPDEVRKQARAFIAWASESDYKLSQPVGFQETLWWQMHPGVATEPVTREYAQITTSAGLSALLPLSSTNVGDSGGTLLAINLANGPMLDDDVPCGTSSMIFHNPDGATDRNVSGSFAIVGDLGSGKSFTLKKEAGAIYDRGGRIIIADRTNMGEWATWASSLEDPRIVDVSQPQWSLDPIRVFNEVEGPRVAQSFLTPLLNIGPTDDQGILLSEVLSTQYMGTHSIASLGELVEHLSSPACELEGARELGRRMAVFKRQDLGRVVFDPEIPPLDLEHRAIVFRTHQLFLPQPSELMNAHLFKQLPLEKLFGRAVFALITAIAKRTCFENRDELAAFVVDEAHAVTSSPESTTELIDFIRDGRKHRAVVMLGSHDPEQDFPSETMRGLIPFRILMRHTDKTLAQNGLRWLDLDPNDETLVDLITKDTSPELGGAVPPHRRGECLIRDAKGDIGRARILPPALTARNQAARTGGREDRAA